MSPYERLLRWYPRVWREAHGEVLVGLLRDADDDAGRTRPRRSDAWAVRVHGLAERLSPTAGWTLATAGALLSLVTVVNVFVLLGSLTEPPSTGWDLVTQPWVLVPALAGAAAPALVTLGFVALLRVRGVVSAPASVLAAAAGCVAWSLAALTSSSFDVGFQRLDAGLEQTPFGAAVLPLFVAATAAGTVAAAVVWEGGLAVVPALRSTRGRTRSWGLRRLVAVALGALTAVVLGVAAMAPGAVFLTGAAVAAACLVASRPAAPRVRAAPRRRAPLVADGRRASAAGQLAVAALALGVLGALLLAVGPDARESLQERGVLQGVPAFLGDGRLLSSLAGVLAAVAVGLVVVPRWGRWTRSLVTATCTALLLPVGAAVVVAFLRPDGDAGAWPVLVGGVLVGLVTAARLPGLLPGGVVVRWSTSALLGAVGGLTLGAGVLVLAPLLTPLAAVGVLVALLVSAARVRRPSPEAGAGTTEVAASS